MENAYTAPESDLENISEQPHVYAGFWIRALASIIDSILILIVTIPPLMLIYGAEYWTKTGILGGMWDVLISYVLPAIAVIVFWLYKSATPGKMICGIKVVSLSGTERLSVGRAIGRYVAYYPSIMVFGLGILWVAFDKRKQGWHDKLANTAVVRN